MVYDTPYLQNEFGDPWFFYVFNVILSSSTCSESFKKICRWEVLGANVLKEKSHPLPVTHRLPPSTRYPPPATRCLPPSALYPPPTTRYPPLRLSATLPILHPLTTARHPWKRPAAVVESICIIFFVLFKLYWLCMLLIYDVMFSICSSSITNHDMDCQPTKRYLRYQELRNLWLFSLIKVNSILLKHE